MPFRLRYLKGTQQYLLDPKSVPENHVLLNPSVAGDVVYIRDIEQTATQQINNVILYNTKEATSTRIPLPMEFLHSTDNYYAGLEDVRIVWYAKRLYFTATSTHASSRLQSEMVVGVFSEDLQKIERMNHLDLGPPPVKNVCPFVHDGKLLLIDTYARVLYVLVDTKPDEEDTTDAVVDPAVFKVVTHSRLGGIPLGIFKSDGDAGLRGTTSPVHLHGNTYGCVVHDIIYDNNVILNTKSKLAYIHQWIEFEIANQGEDVITFVSSPFFCVKLGVEFVSGIDYNKNDNKITLYLGVDDKLPVVIYTTLHDIRA
jgi:hypothetical protein